MERLTRAKAIRAKCIDCCCGSEHEVRLCPCTECPLYRYRLGREDGEGKVTRQRQNKAVKAEPTTD